MFLENENLKVSSGEILFLKRQVVKNIRQKHILPNHRFFFVSCKFRNLIYDPKLSWTEIFCIVMNQGITVQILPPSLPAKFRKNKGGGYL